MNLIFFLRRIYNLIFVSRSEKKYLDVEALCYFDHLEFFFYFPEYQTLKSVHYLNKYTGKLVSQILVEISDIIYLYQL
jgi:hypothetical protein